MSETMVAAGLGLVIPVLAIPVCRKLWKSGLSKARGRASPDGGGLLTVGFALQLSCLLVACYAFNRVASSIQLEAEHFDPYQILDLPLRANATVIRSQYRRLSLKHHPDKNPGNRREANKKFNQVANAYKALSDPTARRNWEQYGHPDGYQPWTFDLALPGWLRPGKDTSNGTLALYAVGYLAVLVCFVLSVKVGLDLLDPVGTKKKPAFEATEEDVMALLASLDDSSSTEDVLECLAACPQLCTHDRQSLAEEMEAITAPLRDWLVTLQGPGTRLLAPRPLLPSATRSTPPHPQGKPSFSRKGKGKGASKAKDKAKGAAASPPQQQQQGDGQGPAKEAAVEEEFFSFGRKGEESRWDTRGTPRLSKVVTHNLVVLLSALHRAGSGGGAPTAIADADAAAAATNASSSSSSDDDDSAGASKEEAAGLAAAAAAAAGAEHGQLTREQGVVFGLAEPLLDACLSVAGKRASPQLFGTVIEAKAMLRRRLWSAEDPAALDRQEKEADVELDAAVPSVKVESIVVETWGESQVALGDRVTATITIVRSHAPEYRGFRRRRPEASFIAKGEPWWVVLAGGAGGNTMIRATPMLVENLGSDVVECKITFQAPRRPGFVPLVVLVKSPVFVGVDCEGEGSFRVYRHEDLKEDEDGGDW